MNSKTRSWLWPVTIASIVLAVVYAMAMGVSAVVWVLLLVVAAGAVFAGIKFEWHKQAEEAVQEEQPQSAETQAIESRSREKAADLMQVIDDALSAEDNATNHEINVEDVERWGDAANEHAVNVGGFVSFVVNGESETVRVVTELTNPDFTDYEDITLPNTEIYDRSDLNPKKLREIVTGVYASFREIEEVIREKHGHQV